MPTISPHADFLASFRQARRSEQILEALARLKGMNVVVVGETILDDYRYCKAIGKSSKEPVLAIQVTSEELMAGGVVAVANHLASFGANVRLLSMLGEVNRRERFVRSKLNPAIAARFVTQHSAPTLVKRRYIEEYFFQRLFEVYEMDDALSGTDDDAVCAALDELLPTADAVVVVDFGHGMLSNRAVEILCSKSPFLAVNAQRNAGNFGFHSISRYRRADHVSLTEAELRLEMRDRITDCGVLTRQLAETDAYRRVVVTRGTHGCIVWTREQGAVTVPAFADKIVDRIGAGDCFLSITGPLSSTEIDNELLGFIGNVVGAEAVEIVGNSRPVDPADVEARIRKLIESRHVADR